MDWIRLIDYKLECKVKYVYGDEVADWSLIDYKLECKDSKWIYCTIVNGV